MDYQRIKYFIKAAETLSFSKAAREMFITPQAFGRQIALLEKEMGFLLFERSTRSIHLTENGKICYDNFSKIVSTLEFEYEKMCEMGKKEKNTINVAFFSPLSRQKIISPAVLNIMNTFSGYEINVNILELDVIAKRLDNGSLDLALLALNIEDGFWDKYDMKVIKRIPIEIGVSLYHKWVVKDKIELDDLKDYDLLQLSTPDLSNPYFNALPCRKHLYVPNYESMLMVLHQGQSYTVLNSEIGDAVDKEQIKVFSLKDVFPGEFLFAVVYKKNNDKPFMKKLIKTLTGTFET